MILVINPGSSSIKYKLFDVKSSKLYFAKSGEKDKLTFNKSCFEKALNELVAEIDNYHSYINYIGYRVVHSGGKLVDGVSASAELVKSITKYEELAPLHNPAAILCLNYLKSLFFQSKHLCYFDTSFFNDLPAIQSTYPLPQKIINQYSIKRFGFHGISHQYAYHLVKSKKSEKVITIHLGAGCSVAAIWHGKPVATSMGFTPLEGVMMQSRGGDIDPGLVLFLVEKIGLASTKEILNYQSGLAGIMATDGRMLDILYLAGEKIEDENYLPPKDLYRNKQNYKLAQFALESYCDSVRKYIGAYAALMTGVDRIIFTGKIGAGSSIVRKKIIKGLEFLKIKNINVVPSDEELAIAQKIVKQFKNNEK